MGDFDALDRKQGDRLNNTKTKPEPDETAIYKGLDLDQPYGRRHWVEFPNGGGVGYGEFITPSAVSVGQKVAVYYGDSDYLFDAL